MKKLTKLLIIFIFIIQLNTISLCDDIDNETIAVYEAITTSTNSENNKNNIPEINSRACVVIDRNSNTIIYGKNENSQKKMASTTKIMTATIIIENCNLDQIVEVSKKSAGTGGSRLGLKTGDKITVRDLLYGLMLCSGNDAAVALAEHAGGSVEGFAELMNTKSESLGLSNTHFVTPHGLDSNEHYTTAYELALLTNYALNNKTFANIVGTKNYTVTINGYPKNLNNTNELLGNFDGIYGVKTGFTNGANRCLVTACKRNDMDIICVVLGADTKQFRTSDSVKLINYAFDNFKLINIEEIVKENFNNWINENSKNIIINKGSEQNLTFKLDNINYPVIPIRKDLIESLKTSIDYKSYFEAPLSENTVIGTISLYNSEYTILKCNFYNSNNVHKRNAFSYFLDIFKNYNNIIEHFLD